MKTKDGKNTLSVKVQLYQKWQRDYQKHQEIFQKEQTYLKQKKKEMDKLWGEISAIYMQQLTDILHCTPDQLLEKLQGLPVTVSESEESQEVNSNGDQPSL